VPHVGIRQQINENRSVTIGAAVGMTVLALLWIVWYSVTGGEIRSAPETPTAAPATQVAH